MHDLFELNIEALIDNMKSEPAVSSDFEQLKDSFARALRKANDGLMKEQRARLDQLDEKALSDSDKRLDESGMMEVLEAGASLRRGGPKKGTSGK